MRLSVLLFPEGEGDTGRLKNLGLDTDEEGIRQALEVFLGGANSVLEDFQKHLEQQHRQSHRYRDLNQPTATKP